MPTNGKSNSPALRIPLLADIIPRGDGTFILRPQIPETDGDTWLTVSQAARILNVTPRSIYPWLGQFVVYQKPLKSRVQVSLVSVTRFKAARGDPEFWENSSLRRRITDQVKAAMDKLIASSLQ